MMGASYPNTVVAHGGNYVWKDGREHADTFTALLEYPEGFLFDWAMSLGTGGDWRYCMYGRNGTIEAGGTQSIGVSNWQVSPRGGPSDSKLEAHKVEATPVDSHMENWLDCIRTRQRPRADIQFGHQHAVASIMSAMALESGKRQKYDPKARTIEPACS
jgi:predicted dehydrogenase